MLSVKYPHAVFACVGVLLFSASCTDGSRSSNQALLVEDWSGSAGHLLPLDQPIFIKMSAGLLQPVPHSWEFATASGLKVEGVQLEVVDSLLRFHVALPFDILLQGGSLQPDTEYQIVLSSLPALSSLRSTGGGAFARDKRLLFKTEPLHSPTALSGLGALPLRPKVPALSPLWAPLGQLDIPFSGAFDPRSFAENARWIQANDGQERLVSIQLKRHTPSASVLSFDLGGAEGWGVLELPASLQSITGEPLPKAYRQFRIKVVASP